MDSHTQNKKENHIPQPPLEDSTKIKKRHILPLAALIVGLLFTIPLTVMIAQHEQNYQSKAAEPSPSMQLPSLAPSDTDLGNAVQFIDADPNTITTLGNQFLTQNIPHTTTSC